MPARRKLSLPLLQPTETPTLWAVDSGLAEELTLPHRAYWYDNAIRPPGICVIQVTTRGSIFLDDAQGRHTATIGQAALFCFGERSTYGRLNPAEPYACTFANLRGAGLAEHWNLIRARFGPIIDLADDERFLDELKQLVTHPGPSAAPSSTQVAAAVHQLVMRLIVNAQRGHDSKQSPVERAVEQILRQPDLAGSLKQVADRHHCSREHLCRVFRARTGQSPGRFLAQARLQRSIRLLNQSDAPLTHIARQVGLRSAHALIRQIRNATGRTPATLRNARSSPATTRPSIS